jgi:hypothetical protein
MEYRPVRILKLVAIHHTSGAVLKDRYPHATIQKSGLTFKAFYKPGSVVDAPLESERALFNAMPKSFAEIPQLEKVGLDDPTSGLARSRKSAYKGEQKFKREIDSGKPPVQIKKETAEVKENE